MSDDLRTLLARRLFNRWWGNDGEWKHVPLEEQACFHRVADECVRQMEWARRRCGVREEDFGHHDFSPVLPDLTIAEDTWRARKKLERKCPECGCGSLREKPPRQEDPNGYFECHECGKYRWPCASKEEIKEMNAHPADFI